MKIVAWFKEAQAAYGSFFLWIIMFVYWAQGMRSYTDIAVSYVLKGMTTPDVTQSVKVFGKQPWNIKWLWGLISDNIPLFKRHCKPYLLVAGVGGILGYIGLSVSAISGGPWSIGACLFLVQLSGAVADVLIDAMVVRYSRGSEEGSSGLQSLCWAALAVGGFLANIAGGQVVENVENKRIIFMISTFIPATMFFLTFMMSEPVSDFKPTPKAIWQQAKTMVMAFFAPPFLVLKTFAWIALSNILSFSVGESTLLFRNSIGLGADKLGFADSLTYVGLFVGTAIYARYLKSVPFRKIFFWAQVLQAICTLPDFIQVKRWNLLIGIPDFLFVIGGDVLAEVFHRFRSMPFLVMSAQLCPPHIEATFFSLLMSLSNLSNDGAMLLGAKLTQWKGLTKTNFVGLDQLILLKIVGTLIPILLLWLIPNSSNLDYSDEKKEKEKPVEVETEE